MVIPTHNRRELLALTLRTVCEQKDVDLEVIVVDDGSREEAAREVVGARQDPRVRLLRNATPMGVSASRNRGVEEAVGRWVAFCDDDDLWAPQKLREQLAQRSRPAARGCTRARSRSTMPCASSVASRPSRPEVVHRRLPRWTLVPGGCSGVIARRDLVRDVGGFDPDLVNLADWDLWSRLAGYGPPAAVPLPLVGYRIHGGNSSQDTSLVLRELDRLDGRYGVRVDRAAVHHYLAWVSLRGGRRRQAGRALPAGSRTRRCRRRRPQSVGARPGSPRRTGSAAPPCRVAVCGRSVVGAAAMGLTELIEPRLSRGEVGGQCSVRYRRRRERQVHPAGQLPAAGAEQLADVEQQRIAPVRRGQPGSSRVPTQRLPATARSRRESAEVSVQRDAVQRSAVPALDLERSPEDLRRHQRRASIVHAVADEGSRDPTRRREPAQPHPHIPVLGVAESTIEWTGALEQAVVDEHAGATAGYDVAPRQERGHLLRRKGQRSPHDPTRDVDVHRTGVDPARPSIVGRAQLLRELVRSPDVVVVAERDPIATCRSRPRLRAALTPWAVSLRSGRIRSSATCSRTATTCPGGDPSSTTTISRSTSRWLLIEHSVWRRRCARSCVGTTTLTATIRAR